MKIPLLKTALALLVPVFGAVLAFVSCDSPTGPDNGGSTPVNAVQPSITTQPSGGNWNVGTTETFPLTVVATSPDGGSLSYQWYSNTSNSTTGGSPTGTNNAILTLNKTDYDENGDYRFYVVVTNTSNTVNGEKTATTTSTVATVTVTGNATAPDTPILISVTPNGGSGTPTTELTLLFDRAVSGLSADDITLSMPGPFGVTKGALSGNGPSYTLGVSSGIDGTLTVTVGLSISGSPATAAIYGGISVTNLEENVWKHGNLTAVTDVHWYKFEVSGGKRYGIWWADEELGGASADIEIRVYANGAWTYGNETTWQDAIGFYNTAEYSYNAAGPGTVYVCIRPYGASNLNYLGTYSVVFSTGSTRPVVVNISATLSSVTPNGGSGTATSALTLTFDKEITGLSAADITLSMPGLYGVTKGTLSGNGPSYTLLIGSPEDGSLTVSVAKLGYDITGSPKTVNIYGNGIIPGQPLVEGVWTDGDLPAGSSVDWYTITATAGTTYRIWWNDRLEGPTPANKTGDVVISAWRTDGTNIFGGIGIIGSNGGIDNGWNIPQQIPVTEDGTVYVRVMPYEAGENCRGTYGIVFSTGETRPEY
jgi:hypothetical protein